MALLKNAFSEIFKCKIFIYGTVNAVSSSYLLFMTQSIVEWQNGATNTNTDINDHGKNVRVFFYVSNLIFDAVYLYLINFGILLKGGSI